MFGGVLSTPGSDYQNINNLINNKYFNSRFYSRLEFTNSKYHPVSKRNDIKQSDPCWETQSNGHASPGIKLFESNGSFIVQFIGVRLSHLRPVCGMWNILNSEPY